MRSSVTENPFPPRTLCAQDLLFVLDVVLEAQKPCCDVPLFFPLVVRFDGSLFPDRALGRGLWPGLRRQVPDFRVGAAGLLFRWVEFDSPFRSIGSFPGGGPKGKFRFCRDVRLWVFDQ